VGIADLSTTYKLEKEASKENELQQMLHRVKFEKGDRLVMRAILLLIVMISDIVCSRRWTSWSSTAHPNRIGLGHRALLPPGPAFCVTAFNKW
jgi:hypothetical protein